MLKVVIAGDFFGGLRLENLIKAPPRQVLSDGVLEVVRKADLAMVNLESPLTNTTRPITKTGPALKADKACASWLKAAGIDLVTLANNHIMDYGAEGLMDTINHLKDADLNFVGAGNSIPTAAEPFFFEKDGIRLAILNFAENEWSTTYATGGRGANPIDEVTNYYQIQAARKKADHVLVVAHGGHEMYRLPSPRMKKLFRFYADAGADAVINHHTHCVSGYEVYRGIPICYSLGNFLFDHQTQRNGIWNQGALAVLEMSENGIKLELRFFDQCKESATVGLVEEEKLTERRTEVESLNRIIADDNRLEAEFAKWIRQKKKMYNAYIEPHRIKPIQVLQNRGLLPSLWARRKKNYLLNLVRCEAHRDILISILRDEDSNPQ